MVGLVFVCIYLTLSHNSSLVLTDQNVALILLDLCIGGFALILTVNIGQKSMIIFVRLGMKVICACFSEGLGF